MRNLKEMENLELVSCFDDMAEFVDNDMMEDADFDWWQNLANSLAFLKAFEEELESFGYDGSTEDYRKQQELASERREKFLEEKNNYCQEYEDYNTFADRVRSGKFNA